jgi:uncharacterized membrane protein YfcA
MQTALSSPAGQQEWPPIVGDTQKDSALIAYMMVLFVGVIAGAVSGAIGTGSSIILLPVLVVSFGPKQAIPIMAVSAVMANLAKVISWWRQIDWRACAAYTATAAPAAALGARVLLVLPTHVVDVALGTFFVLMVPARRWLHARDYRLRLWHLALAGGGIGFLTGIVMSTGPLSVPAFTSYGLVKGAFLSTEAASSLAIYVTKAITFRSSDALPLSSILQGLIVGGSVMAGSFAGRAVVLRMSTSAFQHLLDGLMLCSGLAMLWGAF